MTPENALIGPTFLFSCPSAPTPFQAKGVCCSLSDSKPGFSQGDQLPLCPQHQPLTPPASV